MSEWYDMVGTAVFLIFVFLVPELGVSLWIISEISIWRGSFQSWRNSLPLQRRGVWGGTVVSEPELTKESKPEGHENLNYKCSIFSLLPDL